MNKIQLEAVLKLSSVEIDPKIFQQISRSVAGIPQGLQTTNTRTKQVAASMNQLNTAVTRTRVNLTASQRAAQLFLQRMAQFAVLLPTFATINKAIQGGAKFMVDFESQVRKVIALNIDGLSDQFDRVADSALNIGKTFGVSSGDVVDSIKVFKQAGFSIEESIKKASDAALGASVTSLSLGQAQEALLAIQKQFGTTAGSSSDIIDKLSKAESVAAISADDLTGALEAGGNALAKSTKNFEDAVGVIAALKEQTRKSGSEIGTFAKTFIARISAAGDAQSSLASLGVEIKNVDGSLRPLMDILKDTKDAFDGLSESEQDTAAKSIAGTRQFELFLATLNSLNRAQTIAQEVSNSSGDALKKQAEIAKTFDKQLEMLTESAKALAVAIGNAGVLDFLKDAVQVAKVLVDNIATLVQFTNKLGVSLTPILAGAGLKLGKVIFGGGGIGGGLAGGIIGGGGAGGVGKISPEVIVQRNSIIKTNNALRQLSIALQQTTKMVLMSQKTIPLGSTGRGKFQGPFSIEQMRSRPGGGTAIPFMNEGMKGKFDNINQNFGSFLDNMKNTTTGFATLTAASIALPIAFNKLGDEVGTISAGPIQLSGNELGKVAGTAAQVTLQFGPLAGAAAAFGSALFDLIPALKDNVAAQHDQTELIRKENEIKAGTKGLSGGLGAIVAGGLGGAIRGKSNSEINIDKILKEILSGSASAKLAFSGTGTAGLQRSIFSKQGVAGLAQQDASLFKNQDALKKLRDSYDKVGNSSLNFSDQLKLLFEAFGKVDDEVDDVTGRLTSSLIPTFEELQKRVELFKSGQEGQNTSRDIARAQIFNPSEIAKGLDKLKQEADDSDVAFKQTAERIAKLRDGLMEFASTKFDITDSSKAQELASKTRNILGKTGPEASKQWDEFLKHLSIKEADFVTEVAKIDEEGKKADLARLQAQQAIREEIAQRSFEAFKQELNASEEAAKGLDEFKTALLQFGQSASENTIKKAAGLTEKDVQGIVGGQSSLPKEVQDVIKNGFLTGVAKAKEDLLVVGKEASITIEALNRQIGELDAEMMQLTKVSGGEELKEKTRQLNLQKGTKLLDIENIKRNLLIKQTTGVIKLAEEEKKAADTAKALAEQVHNTTHEFADLLKAQASEVLSKEAEAQSQVQDAQKQVIDSSKNLAASYFDYKKALIEFNGVLVEAKVKSNLLGREIGMLNGSVVTFSDKLTSLDTAYDSALKNANMSLSQRIDLEKQLADSTLSFLQQAESQITSAGTNVFGQTGLENSQLGKGIADLGYVVQQLGGSFKNFLGLSGDQINKIGEDLLNLPLQFRKNALDALNSLPGTTQIGGFNIDQLKQAIGQIGAGVSPAAGLPSVADLNQKQVDELKQLQALEQQSTQLQAGQVIAAKEAVDTAKVQLDVAKITKDRADENLAQVNTNLAEQINVLNSANDLQKTLTQQVVNAQNENELKNIQDRAQNFADQNEKFKAIGEAIITGIGGEIGAALSHLQAVGTANSATGYIPHFAGGNLTPPEAAGLLRAASREKRMMPAGAGLAVANTSEAIIPMHHRGFVPNFQSGNISPIAAGISAVQGANVAVTAAISKSVSQTLNNLTTAHADNSGQLGKVASLLTDLKASLNAIANSSTAIQNNTNPSNASANGATSTAANSKHEVSITLLTNNNSSVQITGLDQLRGQLAAAIKDTTDKHVEQQLSPLLDQLDAVFQSLKERGLATNLGQVK